MNDLQNQYFLLKQKIQSRVKELQETLHDQSNTMHSISISKAPSNSIKENQILYDFGKYSNNDNRKPAIQNLSNENKFMMVTKKINEQYQQFNGSMAQILKENLKIQAEINHNLKALSEKLSDCTRKFDDDSAFFDERESSGYTRQKNSQNKVHVRVPSNFSSPKTYSGSKYFPEIEKNSKKEREKQNKNIRKPVHCFSELDQQYFGYNRPHQKNKRERCPYHEALDMKHKIKDRIKKHKQKSTINAFKNGRNHLQSSRSLTHCLQADPTKKLSRKNIKDSIKRAYFPSKREIKK